MIYLAVLGRVVLGTLGALGRVTIFAFSAIVHIFRPPFYVGQFLTSLVQSGGC